MDAFANMLNAPGGEQQAAAWMERMKALMSKSIKEKMEERRDRFETEYQEVVDLLYPRISSFFKNHASTSKTFPAVDIGALHAIGTITLALSFRHLAVSEGSDMLWYPTDWKGIEGCPEEETILEKETRNTLRYLVKESQTKKPLFIGQNGSAVFNDDVIELNGLKATQYNGRRGVVRGMDPKVPGRFKIQLSNDPKDCKSFKEANVSYIGATTLHGSALHELMQDGKATEFYQGLLDRSCEIDILKQETWSNVEELNGKCALVTCTSLLKCLGYRNPTAWKDTMQLASRLLHTEGYLLQLDPSDCDDYGNIPAMEEFANSQSLGLRLEHASEDIPWGGDTQMKIIIWQKI